MLLVILGAGASFDAANRFDYSNEYEIGTSRLPLTSELFSARREFSQFLTTYPRCQSLAGILRDAVNNGKDFEEEAEREIGDLTLPSALSESFAVSNDAPAPRITSSMMTELQMQLESKCGTAIHVGDT